MTFDVWKFFLAINLVGYGGGNGNAGSTSDGSGTWMGLGVIDGVIAGPTGIGDGGGLWEVTVEVTEFSEKEKTYQNWMKLVQ